MLYFIFKPISLVRLSLDGQKLAGKEKMVDGNTVSDTVGKQLEVKLSLAESIKRPWKSRLPHRCAATA